jgi:hypothetical protein
VDCPRCVSRRENRHRNVSRGLAGELGSPGESSWDRSPAGLWGFGARLAFSFLLAFG